MQGCRGFGILLFSFISAIPAAAQQGPAIAGLHPDVRPAGAPVLAAVTRDDAWFQAALFGVAPPAPESLRWLADQGEWFTPFIHAGMTGPYDLRGWHAAEPKPVQ